MRRYKVVCKSVPFMRYQKREVPGPWLKAPTCPESIRLCVCLGVIPNRNNDIVNLIKATGFIALGIGVGLLSSWIYYSSEGSATAALVSSVSLDSEANTQSPPVVSKDIPQATETRAQQRAAAMFPRPEANQAQQQADTRAALLKLDTRLRSEPVNQRWANEQEATILAAISGDDNDGLPVKLPRDIDTQCRTSLCKITMSYSDEEDAYQMQTKLTLGLRGPIATARAFFAPRADGGMDVTIYAGEQSSLR